MYTNSGVQAYQETNINSMPREKMIVLLYEKVISDLNEVLVAIENGDRVAMTKRTNHSQRIVSELRNSLDHSIGGDISRNLESLYDFMFHEHLEMLVDQDPQHAKDCIRVLTPLLDAWRSLPIGTGEQAARDHARGLLEVPAGPINATEDENATTPVASEKAQQSLPESTTKSSGQEKSELVSVSA